jgi:hypothetical protein
VGSDRPVRHINAVACADVRWSCPVVGGTEQGYVADLDAVAVAVGRGDGGENQTRRFRSGAKRVVEHPFLLRLWGDYLRLGGGGAKLVAVRSSSQSRTTGVERQTNPFSGDVWQLYFLDPCTAST